MIDTTDAPRNFSALVAWARERMEAQAAAGSLYLTDWLSQPRTIADAAGYAALGLRDETRETLEGIDCRNPTRDVEASPVLAGTKVKVRCIGRAVTGENYPFKGKLRWKTLERKQTKVLAMGSRDAKDRQAQYTENWKEVDGPEAELPVSDAWLLLKQSGKDARPAKGGALRELVWLCEEVKPANFDAPAPPLEKRPRRSLPR